jgi:hypothetical protein
MVASHVGITRKCNADSDEKDPPVDPIALFDEVQW